MKFLIALATWLKVTALCLFLSKYYPHPFSFLYGYGYDGYVFYQGVYFTIDLDKSTERLSKIINTTGVRTVYTVPNRVVRVVYDIPSINATYNLRHFTDVELYFKLEFGDDVRIIRRIKANEAYELLKGE